MREQRELPFPEEKNWPWTHVAPVFSGEPFDTNLSRGANCCECQRCFETTVECVICGDDVCCECYLEHVGACRKRWATPVKKRRKKSA